MFGSSVRVEDASIAAILCVHTLVVITPQNIFDVPRPVTVASAFIRVERNGYCNLRQKPPELSRFLE